MIFPHMNHLLLVFGEFSQSGVIFRGNTETSLNINIFTLCNQFLNLEPFVSSSTIMSGVDHHRLLSQRTSWIRSTWSIIYRTAEWFRLQWVLERDVPGSDTDVWQWYFSSSSVWGRLSLCGRLTAPPPSLTLNGAMYEGTLCFHSSLCYFLTSFISCFAFFWPSRQRAHKQRLASCVSPTQRWKYNAAAWATVAAEHPPEGQASLTLKCYANALRAHRGFRWSISPLTPSE